MAASDGFQQRMQMTAFAAGFLSNDALPGGFGGTT
jgi:hypothetical protein